MLRERFMLGALTSLVLFASGSSLRADTNVPVKYRPTVQKALTWLADQQNKRTGHWEAQGQSYPVSMTALAGMALLGEGSTAREGKYARNIRMARDFLMSKARPSGLICDPNSLSEAGRCMYPHAFSIHFLSCVYGEEEDPARRKKLEEVLRWAVKYSSEAQTSRGGWGYVAAREGANFDEGSVTVTQLRALRTARNAGIKVPAEAIKVAEKYLHDATGPDGGVVYSLAIGAAGSGRPALTAAAIVCGLSSGEFDAEHIKKWFQFCQLHVPLMSKTRFGHDEYTHYYYAQAIYVLGDDRYAKLFPASKEADRLTWTKYREETFDFLKQTQNTKGYWDSPQLGPIYATAIYLSILQLDNAPLSSIQR